ncbi:MAG: tRNA-dihydrouridine synthase [Candidatus Saccharimonadales bacterium]
MNSSLQGLPRPFFVLAPMDDVTDTVFRRVVGQCAPPDLYFTEFVNVDGLMSPGRPKLMKRLQYTDTEQPLIAQIWGKNPDNFYAVAQQLADQGYAGIDINMGCPEKNVVRNGTCSALINDRPLAEAIIKAVQKGVAGKIPVSVKTRLGFGSVDYSWHEFLLAQNLAMISVHGRTRAQMSKVPADWAAIGHVRELRDKLSPDTLIVGNGDVLSHQQGLELAAEHSLDGIMIGRGIFHDPYVFAAQDIWPTVDPNDRLALYRRHIELFAATWQHGERPINTLNKFCKVYVSGWDGAKELREQLMASTSSEELLTILDNAETVTADQH